METLRIDIVNPKTKRIIKYPADLNQITIRDKDPIKSFHGLLTKLRSKTEVISLPEITKEVQLVRAKRYGRRA